MTAMPNTPDILVSQGRKTSTENDSITEGIGADERIRNLYRKGKEKVVEAEQSFESYVGVHPIKSLLIASGVGMVLGFLLGRHR